MYTHYTTYIPGRFGNLIKLALRLRANLRRQKRLFVQLKNPLAAVSGNRVHWKKVLSRGELCTDCRVQSLGLGELAVPRHAWWKLIKRLQDQGNSVSGLILGMTGVII